MDVKDVACGTAGVHRLGERPPPERCLESPRGHDVTQSFLFLNLLLKTLDDVSAVASTTRETMQKWVQRNAQ